MKNRVALFILLLFVGSGFAEDNTKKEEVQVAESPALEQKIDIAEKYIKKIIEEIEKQHKEIEELKKEVEQLKEANVKLSQIVRSLEIAVKFTSSIRPDMSQWESIVRGMSSEDVEKVLGVPERIGIEKRVGPTWYYYGLGSITFNEKNLVIDRKTFKEYSPHR
jgi:TolA-binding protein